MADNGYCSDENLTVLANKPIEVYSAAGRQEHGEKPVHRKRGPLPKGATKADKMRRKLQTKTGAAVYAACKAIVEPVFGRSNKRGASGNSSSADSRKCKAVLVCATHNILKRSRLCYA